MNNFSKIAVLSIVTAVALFGGIAMVTPALAQDNMSMTMDPVGNMNTTMQNSTDMDNGTMTIN